MQASEHNTKHAAALLGELLAYPQPDYWTRFDEAMAVIRRDVPEAAEALATFAGSVRGRSLTEHEELFTHTFDINPVSALEIGWHLFGEDYHRGALLVRLRQELRRHGIGETQELPDHLGSVLVLLDCMAPAERTAFARACVLPALEQMLEGFRGKENPYEHLLRAVEKTVRIRCEHAGHQECPRQVR